MDKAAFFARLRPGRVEPAERPPGWPLPQPEDPPAMLLERLKASGCGVHRRDTAAEALAAALAILADSGHNPCGVSHLGPDFQPLLEPAARTAGVELVSAGDGSGEPRELVAPLKAGLTRAELAVAEEGAIIQTAHNGGGRWLSLMPDLHVALIKAGDVLPSLAAVPAVLQDPARFPHGPPPAISFIGGPSKTGDIEAVIVLGVHGPARLEVVLWG